ncbi:MAG: hypothetical protein ACOX7X_11175 [Methanosarcina flavescens]|uniref:Uncharacterized protein n=1 Tax=Methanosarcina flavescens TaxID=1715806 RepID=A0A660HR82_9EURY|nr:hypothetical protein [Methanosarcina flavescens]AYK14754.1 hypothetical protein AOB57_005740 [Methanosarcina flavescens]
MRNFAHDDSAWADFLISKAALILASVILFAAIFHLAASFKELEIQEQLDILARDFKTAVDMVGSSNSGSDSLRPDNSGSDNSDPGNSGSNNLQADAYYCFEDEEIFRNSPFMEDIKVKISGEYICLETEYRERSFRAVKPFTFKVLPFNESVLHEKLSTKFGARGDEETSLTADYAEIEAFLQAIGTEEAVLDPNEKISLKKKLIYVKDEEGVSAFGCVLAYQ